MLILEMVPSLKLTASLHLKMDVVGRQLFPFVALNGLFSGAFAVSFRVPGKSLKLQASL